ncbi:hypothetical protein [Terasakiella pusilla]|uniref:hypothetical protein n=1 Tax=Terasakiella pusilla TaxID=64973 RepID=UPI003AA86EE2
MNRSIEELKIRAKKFQNKALEGEDAACALLAKYRMTPDGLQRKTCLNVIAKQQGFTDWRHAKIVLGGEADRDQDQGSFWHSPSCSGFLNNWFAHYSEARDYLSQNPDMYLLPYKKQYMVVAENFIKAINLSEQCAPYWKAVGHDLIDAYGSSAWQTLVWTRIVRG